MILNYKILAILLVFLLGLYYYVNSSNIYNNDANNYKQPVDTKSFNNKCPNMLIEKDGKILLFNSKAPIIPDVNPVQFNTLEEYAEFIEMQKSQNIKCPILYLQYTTDTQNNDLLQIKPSIFENTAGLPINKSVTVDQKKSPDYFEKNKMHDATLNSTPNSNIKFNTGMYSGFDQYNQNIGVDTPLDFLYTEKTSESRNPMDTNWGGKEHTKNALVAGEYEGRQVYKYTN